MSLIGDGSAYRQQAQQGLMNAAEAEQSRNITNTQLKAQEQGQKMQLGASGGALAGAMIGSVIPGVGTVVGAGVGAIAGGLIGRKL